MPKKLSVHIPVTNRQRFIETGQPLQRFFEERFKLLPEFDFYATSEGGEPAKGPLQFSIRVSRSGKVKKNKIEVLPHYDQYMKMLYDKEDLHRPTEILFAVKRKFMEIRDDAKSFERGTNFEEAARSYEWLVAQEYPLPYAYDRLIKIYKDHELIKDAIEVAEEGILFFTELRTRQSTYVGELAKKYGQLDYFLDRILGKQKVFYYGGSFELYNPFPIIDKWKLKLEKLRNYAS